jgi:hypothetical protein
MGKLREPARRAGQMALGAVLPEHASTRRAGRRGSAPEYQLPYTRASQKLGHVLLFGKPVTVMRT